VSKRHAEAAEKAAAAVRSRFFLVFSALSAVLGVVCAISYVTVNGPRDVHICITCAPHPKPRGL